MQGNFWGCPRASWRAPRRVPAQSERTWRVQATTHAERAKWVRAKVIHSPPKFGIQISAKNMVGAKEEQLKITTLRHVFAVGEQHPKLHNILGTNPMYVVATEDCTFGGGSACYVWWSGTNSGAGLYWVSFCADEFDWFLFRK